MKKVIFKVFKGMAIIAISLIVMGVTVGSYNEQTSKAAVYPSWFNNSIYSNALPIVSGRMFKETDELGTGFTMRTYQAYVVPTLSDSVSMYSTEGKEGSV